MFTMIQMAVDILPRICSFPVLTIHIMVMINKYGYTVRLLHMAMKVFEWIHVERFKSTGETRLTMHKVGLGEEDVYKIIFTLKQLTHKVLQERRDTF